MYKKQLHFLIRAIILSGMMLHVDCVSIREFYPDSYYEQDRIYQNESIGFTLTYRGNWLMTTKPEEMTGASKKFAKSLYQSGADLLFVGFTVEGTQGTRGIATNLNLMPQDYAEQIRNINLSSIDNDLGMTALMVGDMPMVEWTYRIGDFQFVEYFFLVDTYNIRVAFWTKFDLFENFLPIYEDVISSITFNRY